MNRGKAFETILKQDWKRSFPNTFIYRLHDQLSGLKMSSQNPCDFICFTGKYLFLVEAKSHKGSSVPFTAIPQYERLLKYKNIKNVFAGVIIWFIEKDLVVWVGINSLEKMVLAGEKSVKISTLKNYGYIKIPSIKKRVFMQSDYTILEKEADKIDGRI